jgi:hypothetical protein
MHPPDPPRLCTKCPIPHVENCAMCLGWGLEITERYPDGVPIFADKAHNQDPSLICWVRCPTCGGTPKGRQP